MKKFRRGAAGFSMIEVLIALLVLAFGLLGFALLQTMNLRYAQSANQRTQATNLAYNLLDTVRATRASVNEYTALTPGSFAAPVCPQPAGGSQDPTANMDRWRCKVKETLGQDAQADFTVLAPGVIQLEIQWGDQRWDASNPNTTFDVRTRL